MPDIVRDDKPDIYVKRHVYRVIRGFIKILLFIRIVYNIHKYKMCALAQCRLNQFCVIPELNNNSANK